MNNKAQITNIIFMVAILFIVIIVGLGVVFGSMIINFVFDETVPELSTLGNVGSSNLTEVADLTIVPLNNVVQSFTWLTGVIYVLALFAMIGLAFAFRMTGDKWLISFFVACMFLLVLTSMFVSNIYEEFFNDGSEVGDLLHEHVIMSWLLLYSPAVMSVIGFICGVIMFTGENEFGGSA